MYLFSCIWLCMSLIKFIIYCNVPANTSNMLASLNSIPNLTGSNYKDWKEQLLITLGCMDLDMSLIDDKPEEKKDATDDQKAEYNVKPQLIKAKTCPVILSEKLECVRLVCEDKVNENVIFVDRDYYLENQAVLEKQAEDGKKVVVFIDKPLNVLGEDIVFRIHTLEEEVGANNLVYRSETNKYTKEFGELEFQNFYNKEKEGGLCVIDEDLNIDWKIDMTKANILDRDLNHPKLKDLEPCF